MITAESVLRDDIITKEFVGTIYPTLASALSPTIYILAILYWALYGLQIHTGKSALNWQDFLSKVIMTVFVFLALDWNGFAYQIYAAFTDFSESTASTIMAGESTGSMLDALFDSVGRLTSVLLNVDVWSIGIIILGSVMFFLNCILLVIAICYMSIAKLGMAVTMLLMPIFLGFFMFEQTRSYAMSWFNKMLNFAFMYILVIAIVKVGFVAFGEAIDEVKQASTATDAAMITIDKIANIYLIEAILIYFMWHVRSWAAELSSGALTVGSATMSKMTSAASEGISNFRKGKD